MLLNLGGKWYKIRSHPKCGPPGYVHHESGKIVVRPDILNKLKSIRGDTIEMKKVFNKLKPVDYPEQLKIK